MRRLPIVLVLGLTLPFLPAPAAAAFPCASPEVVPVVGLVCRVDGLLMVLGPDGENLGYTHGPDPAGDGPEAPAAGPIDPACSAGGPSDYYIQVIYARASNDADNYATQAPAIRTLTRNAVGVINDAGLATGNSARLKVKCVSGTIDVKHEVLATPKSSNSFSNIVDDLTSNGYTNSRVHHWVFYDEPTCSCGVGHVYNDDSLSISNLNNGNGAALFAVSWVMSTRVWAHETSHNMGAVQKSAPHSTDPAGSHPNGWHCTDGLDTMCYNDGAPLGGSYTTGACGVEVYDCGKDDYFNVNPTAGSYLATHWNIGNTLNRYIQFGNPPIFSSLSCSSPVILGESSTSCTFAATDVDSSGVRYTIDWGDGSPTTCVPAGCSAYATPGVSQSSTHSFASAGTKTVAITATDNGSPAYSTSQAVPVVVQARPNLASLSCQTPVAVGAPGSMCTFTTNDADSTGVRHTIDWGDASTSCYPTCSTYAAPGVSRSLTHAYATAGARTVTVTSVDNGSPALTSNTRTFDVNVIVDTTAPTVTVDAPKAGNVYFGCTATPAPGAPRPVFAQTGCADIRATDIAGIGSIQVYWRGTLVGTDSSPSDGRFTLTFPAGAPGLNLPLAVFVRDTTGNLAEVTVRVDAAGT